MISLTVCLHIALGYIHIWEHWSNSSDRFLPNFYEKSIKRTQWWVQDNIFSIVWHITFDGNNRQSIMTQFGMIMEAFFTRVNEEDWRLDFSYISSCDVSKGRIKFLQKRSSGEKKEGTQWMTLGKGGCRWTDYLHLFTLSCQSVW